MKRSLWCLTALVLLAALPASARRASHHKSKAKHHCVKDDEEVDSVKSSKACKKAGGKWVKSTTSTTGFDDKDF